MISEMSQKLLLQIISNLQKPVVMFALEWCEFCWSVRKLFKSLSIPFTSVDLDSLSYQTGNLGDKLKATLVAHTGCNSLPQVFVKGEFVGSCTELFDSVNNRKLFQRLSKANVPYNAVLDIDPYTLLPGWMHARTPEETPVFQPPQEEVF